MAFRALLRIVSKSSACDSWAMGVLHSWLRVRFSLSWKQVWRLAQAIGHLEMVSVMSQFTNGFLFTSGGIAAFLCAFAVAALCEFIAKLMTSSGREEIDNAIVANAASICAMADRMADRRSNGE